MGEFSVWHWLIVLGAVGLFIPGIVWGVRSARRNPDRGVGGFLAFFVYTLYLAGCFTGLFALAALAGSTEPVEKFFIFGSLGSYSAISFVVASRLRSKFTRLTVLQAQAYLVTLPVLLAALGVAMGTGESLWEAFKALVSVAPWMVYLFVSKRVGATYVEPDAPVVSVPADTGVTPAPIGVAPRTAVRTPGDSQGIGPHRAAPSKEESLMGVHSHPVEDTLRTSSERSTSSSMSPPQCSDEDALYEVIGLELQSGKQILSVWTRAFAEAGGDENRARAIYIQLRFQKLKAEQEEKARRLLEHEQAQKERVALADIQASLLGDIERARRANDTMDAARFRSCVAQGAVADARALLRDFPHFVFLRSAASESMLHVAVRERLPQIVGLLLEHGAGDWPDFEGRTALGLAKAIGDSRLVELLEPSSSADLAVDFREAAVRGPYRGRAIVVLSDGRAKIEGEATVYRSFVEAADAIDAKVNM